MLKCRSAALLLYYSSVTERNTHLCRVSRFLLTGKLQNGGRGVRCIFSRLIEWYIFGVYFSLSRLLFGRWLSISQEVSTFYFLTVHALLGSLSVAFLDVVLGRSTSENNPWWLSFHSWQETEGNFPKIRKYTLSTRSIIYCCKLSVLKFNYGAL